MLGFKPRGERDRDTEFAWILMTPPARSARIALIQPNTRQQPGRAQGLMLQTIDIEHLHRRLSEQCLEIRCIQQASWGWYATFADPDGNGWAVAEPNLDI